MIKALGQARPWQWFVGIAVLLLAIPLVRIGIADFSAETAPQKALEWWPGHSEAQLRSAKAASVAPNASAASNALAERMLTSSPLSGAAYALLGAGANAGGDKARAAALFTLAARRRPRDRLSHAWLADDAGSRGDIAMLITHLDRLLTLSPGQTTAIFPTFASLVSDPDGRAALVGYVANKAPPWRQGFLAQFAATAADANLVSQVFNTLRRAKFPLTPAERELWSRRLLRDGQVQQAYYLWVESMTSEQREFLGNVFDGGFELVSTGSQFDWRFGSVPGALIGLQGGGGVSGRQALTIKFHYRHVQFRHVTQTLALPPGNYRLLGRLKLDSLQTERGLQWTVSCAGSRVALGASDRFSGRAPWSDFSTNFSVPADACKAQVLTLEIPARTRREQWVGGQVWFDDLVIRRAVASDQARSDTAAAAAL